jgi:hypothetical protein
MNKVVSVIYVLNGVHESIARKSEMTLTLYSPVSNLAYNKRIVKEGRGRGDS